MTAKEIMSVVRSAIRPYIAFLFTTAVVAIGTIVAFKLLPEAVEYIDRDIALVIIVAVLVLVTMIGTATAVIMGFYFGERAAKPKEDK